jgi:hypothetical protein
MEGNVINLPSITCTTSALKVNKNNFCIFEKSLPRTILKAWIDSLVIWFDWLLNCHQETASINVHESQLVVSVRFLKFEALDLMSQADKRKVRIGFAKDNKY